MGIFKSICEDSLDFDNELFRNPPYPLAMDIEELTSPSITSRKAIRFRKHPHLSTPPRPQNAWVLFRRNYTELLKLKGDKMNNGDISRLAADEWRRQPPKVLKFFELLETRAKEKNKKLYPGYKFSPKRRTNFKQNHQIEKELHSENSVNQIDTTPEEMSLVDNLSEDLYFLEGSNPPNDFLLYNEYSYVENLEMINNQSSQQAIFDQTFDQDGFDISEYINLELTY
ncbi:hypothetical protein C2G38_2031886 [Gigaspora rosea]|uniref:HMG box domain-containing protein n=1 Tax=Gigaspora rosea TaxID=44941 RepID=A0A397VRP5_9GLOM|nr:hypothetical protein C2G38_2031886 [Gigaspora rosea]